MGVPVERAVGRTNGRNLRAPRADTLLEARKPNEAPYQPDFYDAANSALANRPELLLLRQDLKALKLNLLLQKNLRQADLRSFFQYDVAGLGTRLDGDEFANPARTIPGNAFFSSQTGEPTSKTAVSIMETKGKKVVGIWHFQFEKAS